MRNVQPEILNAVPVTDVVDGHTWIHIAGYVCSGKSVLLQAIVDNAVANDDRLIVHTFNPQGMGDRTIEEARKLEKSIYLLQRKCQDGLQACKVFVAIHEWHLLLKLVSDRRRLYDAIVDIFENPKWGVVFGIASQTFELIPVFDNRLRHKNDGRQLKILLGTRAVAVASKTWATADARYLWLFQQKRPCIISGNNLIRLAIVPEVQPSKPNN